MIQTPFQIWQPIEPNFFGHGPDDELNAIPRRKVYEGYTWLNDSEMAPHDAAMQALEQLFERFNLGRPADFTGHSLSVNDVVVLGEVSYRCAPLGWVACPAPTQEGPHVR